jgi:hypothetical protein
MLDALAGLTMAIAADETPLVLIGGAADPALAQQLQAQRYGVVQVPTGGRVIEWAGTSGLT